MMMFVQLSYITSSDAVVYNESGAADGWLAEWAE